MQGVSLTHRELSLSFLFFVFWSGLFLLHIPSWFLFLFLSLTHHMLASLFFICAVSLRHPVLASLIFVEFFLNTPFWLHFLCGEFLLYIQYNVTLLPSVNALIARGMFCGAKYSHHTFTPIIKHLITTTANKHPGKKSFMKNPTGIKCAYHIKLQIPEDPLLKFTVLIKAVIRIIYNKLINTSRAGFISIWGVSLTHPVLTSFLSVEILLHIPCWLHFYLGSFSYTSRASFILIRRISLTHPMLTLCLCGEFFLHIPCCLHFYAGSSSYTPHAVLIFMDGVSLTHPVLASSFLITFLIIILLCFYVFIWRVSLTHHILVWLHFYLESFSYTSGAGFLFFYLGSFSYTSHAGFNFIRGVSFTHPMLASFLSGVFLLHIPYWLCFYLWCFSYTSRAGFIFMRGVSLTHPVLVLFLCREFLLREFL